MSTFRFTGVPLYSRFFSVANEDRKRAIVLRLHDSSGNANKYDRVRRQLSGFQFYGTGDP